MSHVYIVHHIDEPRLKIGKADTVHKRLRDLGLFGKIDYSRSWQLCCPDNEVLLVEKLLQNRFIQHRHDQPVSDGYTEWFNADRYAEIIAQAQRCADGMGYTLEPLTAIEPSTPTSKPEIRKPPKRVSFQTLRPWITIAEQYPHTLGYAFNTNGALYIYLDAQGQDALDIRELFTGYQKIDPPSLGFKAEPLTECRAPLGGETTIHARYNASPPTLHIKTSVRSTYMKCDPYSDWCSTGLIPAIKRVSHWIHRQLERPDIRQLTGREVSQYKRQYNGIQDTVLTAFIDDVLTYAQEPTG